MVICRSLHIQALPCDGSDHDHNRQRILMRECKQHIQTHGKYNRVQSRSHHAFHKLRNSKLFHKKQEKTKERQKHCCTNHISNRTIHNVIRTTKAVCSSSPSTAVAIPSRNGCTTRLSTAHCSRSCPRIGIIVAGRKMPMPIRIAPPIPLPNHRRKSGTCVNSVHASFAIVVERVERFTYI